MNGMNTTQGGFNGQLENKPLQPDWNQQDNTKGDFIKNKPTIPDVNNPAVTISQNGKTKGSFTLNQSSNKTITLDADLIAITYSQLLAMRNGRQLVPGTWCRITDYQCTTAQTDTQSAGHAFDIIVRADDINKLNENAFATIHNGDTYFQSCKLEAWELKYCLDNDANRFAWANAQSGKGVVYYMKDEFGNECPYDFKNIMFKRKLTNGVYDPSGSDTYVYTFNAYKNTQEDASVLSSSNYRIKCFNNKITEYKVQSGQNMSKLTLNSIVFLNTYTNTAGFECSNNSFSTYCFNNTFGASSQNNTFGNGCTSNTFGNSCSGNTFGNSCVSNTFGNSCQMNTFGNNCFGNTFGNNCGPNTFGNYCSNNTFGNNCQSNTFGNNCGVNTFGNDCYSNTFGNSCGVFQVEYVQNCTVFDGVVGVAITGTQSSYVQYCQILNGQYGGKSGPISIPFVAGTTITQVACMDSSGNVIIYKPCELAAAN